MSESIRHTDSWRPNGIIALLLLMVLIPGFAWWGSVGDIRIYFDYDTPPGQVCYVFSKLAGMYAAFMLWLQVILALVRRTRIGDKLTFWNTAFHRKLGIATFVFVILHATLFATAVSLRKAHFDPGVLLPVFSEGYYALAVSLGVLALYALVIIVFAGYLRKKGVHNAKWLHRLSIPAFLLVQAHCLLIGTETRYLVMMIVYGFMLSTLFVAIYGISLSSGSSTRDQAH